MIVYFVCKSRCGGWSSLATF